MATLKQNVYLRTLEMALTLIYTDIQAEAWYVPFGYGRLISD